MLAGFLSEAIGFSHGCSIIGVISFALCLIYVIISYRCTLGERLNKGKDGKVENFEEIIIMNHNKEDNLGMKVNTSSNEN